MDSNYYYYLINNEIKARRYLSKKSLKNGHRFCPRCNSRNLYKLADNRRRCSRCKYTFHDFSGRWINQGRLTCVQWLSLIKLFESEVSVRKMSKQMGLSYRAVYRAVNTIRTSIMSHTTDAEELLSGETKLDESYIGGRCKGNLGCGAAGKVPVWGIQERNGFVQVMVVHDVTAEWLLESPVKKICRGSFVYTDRMWRYDSLMFYGYRHLKIDHKELFASGKVYIDRFEGFWNWAKKLFIKHHGISKENFPLYLKELEFRYNNRNDDLFDLIASVMCNLVPKRD